MNEPSSTSKATERALDVPASAVSRWLRQLALPKLVRRGRKGLSGLVLLWACGIAALVLMSVVCFQLGLNFATAAFALLIAIVFLSLLDSFISSVVFSVTAVLSLNFLFVEPLFTLGVSSFQDLAALVAFLVSSLAVTSLMRQVRNLENVHREQAALLDLTTDAVFSRDLDDVITYWNRGAEELYGWKRDEAVGKAAHHLLKTVFPAPPAEINHALARTGRWEGELIHTTRGGTQVSVASRWSRQQDERGEPLGTLESNTDVTDRRRDEDAVRQSQAAYLAEAQKLSHTGSVGWNVVTKEVFWSEETFRIFELDPATPPSLELILQRVHPDDRDAVRTGLDDARDRGNDFSLEHRLLMPDGSIKHLRVVVRGTVDERGRVQFIGAVMDVTAQKKAIADLERSELRYRQLFTRMPIALRQLDATRLVALFRKLRAEGVTDLGSRFDSDPDLLETCMAALNFQEANDRAVQMFGGRDPGDYLGRPLARTWRERPDTFRRAMESRYRGETHFEEETKMVTWDGRVIDVLFATARVGTINDMELSLVGTIDISERVRAQEALQKIQAEFAHAARVSMLGELAASIAHEINQPLTAIATHGAAGLRWLDRPVPDLVEVRRATESMVANTRRAADIVERIRAMASGKTPERTLLLLDAVIAEALLFLKHEVQARAVTIVHHQAQYAPQVLGDRTQLQQVVVNLAINAMQAMAQSQGRHRRITISTTQQERATLCCTVEDSGPGIEPEHLGRLFDSFFTTKESGMGMGLPICRSIVEAHGGRMIVDNGSADGGARFRFTLPACIPAQC